MTQLTHEVLETYIEPATTMRRFSRLHLIFWTEDAMARINENIKNLRLQRTDFETEVQGLSLELEVLSSLEIRNINFVHFKRLHPHNPGLLAVRLLRT